jgi:transcriptional regulator with AAA-type ATPase domain
MSWLRAEDRRYLELVARLAVTNPFVPERKRLERQLLGDAWVPDADVWSARGDPRAAERNVVALTEHLAARLDPLRAALSAGVPSAPEEHELYRTAVLVLAFHRHSDALLDVVTQPTTPERGPSAPLYPRLRELLAHWLAPLPGPPAWSTEHTLAIFVQMRRAFVEIFEHLVGASRPAARLRAEVWESIFTHDLRRYGAGLYRGLRDVATLIVGPSGTGKELVARAIGRAQYVPFDVASGRFAPAPFLALNLAALPATLIESELFGHAEGAFTGATRERAGWLEVAGAHGAVFLDELAELAPELSVKLLRVLQVRRYTRVGESTERVFGGKLLAATNRDLVQAMAAGELRADLYYRLCADVLRPPTLAEQLADAPGELAEMVRFVVRGMVGDVPVVDELVAEVTGFIHHTLGREYAWPGNFRELEQCVRAVVVHGRYTPAGAPARGPGGGDAADPVHALTARARAGAITAEELVSFWTTWTVAETGSYVEAARRLGLDRRTVKARVDEALLAELARARR